MLKEQESGVGGSRWKVRLCIGLEVAEQSRLPSKKEAPRVPQRTAGYKGRHKMLEDGTAMGVTPAC